MFPTEHSLFNCIIHLWVDLNPESGESETVSLSRSAMITINKINSYIWCNNLLYVLYCGNFDTITFYHCIFKLVYKAFYHWFVDVRSVIRGNSYKHPLHPPLPKNMISSDLI